MKKFIFLAIAVLVLVGFVSQASADSFTYPNSGIYLGTFAGNDNDLATVLAQINGSIAYTGPDIELDCFSFYAKVEEPDNSTTEGPGQLYVTYADGGLSGTWQTFMSPATSGSLLDFYSVKSSTEYALYWENPADDHGTWNTGDLGLNPAGNNYQAISHFAGWINTCQPVPEPATMLLLGVGLVGLAGASRKKLFKKS